MRVWLPYLIRKVNYKQSNVTGSHHGNNHTHAHDTERGQTNGFCREITKTVTDKIGADVL